MTWGGIGTEKIEVVGESGGDSLMISGRPSPQAKATHTQILSRLGPIPDDSVSVTPFNVNPLTLSLALHESRVDKTHGIEASCESQNIRAECFTCVRVSEILQLTAELTAGSHHIVLCHGGQSVPNSIHIRLVQRFQVSTID
jgi:hypothetical protein